MSAKPILRFCLEAPLLKSATAGEHNFINIVSNTAKNADFEIEFCPSDDVELLRSVADNVYTLCHMKQPPTRRGLVFRRVYHYPFWQIDPSAERWRWEVAQSSFDPAAVDPRKAEQFARFWKTRLFADAPFATAKEGLIYVPLQGKLTAHRSFQRCSPIDMLTETMRHRAGRKVIATLHPKEKYSDADLQALESLEKSCSDLTVTTGGMEQYLQSCDFVVTQNSSAAFAGYFFGKAALLFADIDFHHIAVSANRNDLANSFAQVAQLRPDFDKYLWWFWQAKSINAGREDAGAKIAARFQSAGWPMK